MRLKTILLTCSTVFMSATLYAQPSELDRYLVQHDILDAQYKIKNEVALNEILAALNDEDSRTLPYQVDQNTVLEQVQLYADHIDIRGLIITPDFEQYVQDIGNHQIKHQFHQAMLKNCQHFFEHEFQKVNPYQVKMTFSSEKHHYQLEMLSSECKFQFQHERMKN